MPASSNRQERRRAARVHKDPWVLHVMEPSGDRVSAGVYFDIINTQWRGASLCSYTYEEGANWSQLLSSTKLYFAPLHDKFETTVATSWANDTRLLFTLQGKNMLVNVSFRRKEEQAQTLNLIFPECIMDISDVEALVQKKSSSLFQVALNNWRLCVKNYTLEQRQEMYETYLSGGHMKEWAKIVSGLAPQEYLECNICTILLGEVMTPLLQIFRTLAFMDYALQRGHMLMEDHMCFSLSTKAIADVEAVCTNHTSAVSTCPITYHDTLDDEYSEIVGNFYKFYNVYTKPVRGRHIEYLRLYAKEPVVDLNEVTEASRGRYFYLDFKGNPMVGVGSEESDAAAWMITATGLHHTTGGFAIFGWYQLATESDSWEFVRFDNAFDIFRQLEQNGVKGLSVAKWQPILKSDFELKGRGLRESIDEEEELPSNVRYYKCSNEMFDSLQEGSNIQTLDQMNFFIEGFLRMLRRRKSENRVDSCYNTGLVNKVGQYMWLCIPNLMGKFDAIQPSLVYLKAASIYSDCPYRFYRDEKYLFLDGKQIKVDENSLLHAAVDRENRIPAKLASMSKPQLMEWVRDSIRYSQQMLLYNPLFAQPCYSERYDRVCHLIPLYSDHTYDREHLAGALFICNGRVATIYTVEMARDHACLFNVPKAVWLPE